MKAVYMAVVILVLAFTYGQYANAESGAVLADYYTEYGNGTVLIQKAHKVEKRAGAGWNCYPYGDQEVGYYQTLEQYKNAYDPSIYAVE